jgi:hypothetical protein
LFQERRPLGLPTKILSAGVVTAIAGLGLTDARDASEQKMPAMNLVVSDSIDLHTVPAWNDPWVALENEGPSFVSTYDVTPIFETMPESLSASRMTPEEQLAAWLPLPSSLHGRFHVAGSTLSANLTARQHQLLRQTLEIWEQGEPEQITIEARYIRTDIHTASSIDWAGDRIDGLTVKGLGPAIAARIDEPELARLVRTVSSDPRGNIMFAPKVTLFDGQTAGIADQVKRPFVTGVDPQSDGSMQPIVSVVDEGLNFVLTPRISEDDNITLDFKVNASSIGKVSYANLPIKPANAATAQFTVQVPATEQYEVSSSVKLAAGESVVVAIPRVFDNAPGADADSTVIVALTPRIIKQESPEESESAN